MISALVATGNRRSLRGPLGLSLKVAAAGFAAWVIYANLFVISDPLVLGVLFVAGILSLLFIAIGHGREAPENPTTVDFVLSALSAITGAYFFVESETISERITFLDPLTTPQLFFGGCLLALVMEATRRTAGLGLTAIVGLFLIYNWFGSWLPAPFGHGIKDFSYSLDILLFTTDGVFGVPIQVIASYVFIFVLFGTLLAKAGGGQFFFDLASAMTRGARGGPAKVAVISSGLFGTISGSPTSDVVATGSITIPIMKRLGYSGRVAGGIEVAASTGGSAMPPIMGAAAFILAEFTATPYREIIYAALIPAILYYVGLFAQVHFRAVNQDLSPGDSDGPKLLQVLVTGWLFLIPLVTIVAMLLAGFTPLMTAGAGGISVVAASLIRARTRLTLWAIIEALGETTLRILPVAGACAAAGLVIGGLSMTGLGMKIASLIVELSAGKVYITLALAAVVTIILGMGMPTPSAYILAAVLVGPALTDIGLPLLVAHLFLFYFAVLSALTPPIAVAALAAATIADDDPFLIAFHAVRLAVVGFFLPFAFVWNPAFLGQGEPLSVALAVFGGSAAAVALALAVEGRGRPHGTLITVAVRCALLPAIIAAVSPDPLVSLIGIAACVSLSAILLYPRTEEAPR